MQKFTNQLEALKEVERIQRRTEWLEIIDFILDDFLNLFQTDDMKTINTVARFLSLQTTSLEFVVLDELKNNIRQFLGICNYCKICTPVSNTLNTQQNASNTSDNTINRSIDQPIKTKRRKLSKQARAMLEQLADSDSLEELANETEHINEVESEDADSYIPEGNTMDSDIEFMKDYFTNTPINGTHGENCIDTEVIEFMKIKTTFTDNIGFWQVFKVSFKNLFKCYEKLNSLMFSNSEIERFFSRAKILSDWHRNRTSIDMLRKRLILNENMKS
eukprot:GAHX01001674.1.p1 GENE.GAHX01001674.1~~GAHX01001674.1.p1  ORF type:complete len:275 (-),score=51.06 GAHX01001674.1:32-856(-)